MIYTEYLGSFTEPRTLFRNISAFDMKTYTAKLTVKVFLSRAECTESGFRIGPGSIELRGQGMKSP
jgi:hypothetical protein